jgi:hypothetical protein
VLGDGADVVEGVAHGGAGRERVQAIRSYPAPVHWTSRRPGPAARAISAVIREQLIWNQRHLLHAFRESIPQA